MRRSYLLAAASAFFAAATGPAVQADGSGIVAHYGKVVETASAGLATPGFLEIDNPAMLPDALPDALTGADCPIAGSTRIVARNGAVISQLPVAAGTRLQLNAKGPHLLLQATHFSIDRGSAISCTLSFTNAGAILVYLYAIPAA